MHQDPEVRVKSIRFDRVTMLEASAIVTAFATQRFHPKYVCFGNVQRIGEATGDTEVAKAFEEADLVLAETPPVTWLVRITGHPIPQSISKKDIVHQVGLFSMASNCRVFLLGGDTESLRQAGDEMERSCPGANIVGRYSPPGGALMDWGEQMRVRAVVRSSSPDIVLVAFDSSMQERWIRNNLLEINAPVMIGVGDAFAPSGPTEKIKNFIGGIPTFVKAAASISYDRLAALFDERS